MLLTKNKLFQIFIISLFIGTILVPTMFLKAEEPVKYKNNFDEGYTVGIKDENSEIDLSEKSRDTDWWPMFGHDINHLHNSSISLPTTNRIKWSFETNNLIRTSPIVADGFVFISSKDDKLYCIDAENGSLIWDSPGFLRNTPVYHQGKLYTGNSCLYANNGSTKWSFGIPLRVPSSPILVNDKVYFGSYTKAQSIYTCKIYCVNASTGSIVWQYEPGCDVVSSPAFYENKIYVGSYDGYLYCLNAINGSFIWKYSTAGTYIASSPMIYNDKVYFGCRNGRLYCLDPDTGNLIWYAGAGGYVLSSPAAAYGNIYIGSDGDKFSCFDAENGSLKWYYNTDADIISSAAVADGKVFVGSRDKIFYCFDAFNGEIIWTYITDGNIESSPAIANGLVYIASYDKKIYCFGLNQTDLPPDQPEIKNPKDNAVNQPFTVSLNITANHPLDKTMNISFYGIIFDDTEDNYSYAGSYQIPAGPPEKGVDEKWGTCAIANLYAGCELYEDTNIPFNITKAYWTYKISSSKWTVCTHANNGWNAYYWNYSDANWKLITEDDDFPHLKDHYYVTYSNKIPENGLNNTLKIKTYHTSRWSNEDPGWGHLWEGRAEWHFLMDTFSDISSNESVSVTWENLSENTMYRWYVVVNDGNNTIQGPISKFTTHSIPQADFEYAPTTPNTSDVIDFVDKSSDDGQILNWTWNFGDGQTSYEQNTTHSYNNNGNYSVCLTVTDDNNATNTICKSILVDNVGPIANFSYTPLTPSTHQQIQFHDYSSDNDGQILNWTWNFGDGQTSYEQQPTHTYTTIGNYSVCLNVTDDDGDKDEKCIQLLILPDSPPSQTISLGSPLMEDIYYTGMVFLDLIGSQTTVWINSTDIETGTEYIKFKVFQADTFGEWDDPPWIFVYDNQVTGDPFTTDADPSIGRISIAFTIDENCFHEIHAHCIDTMGNWNYSTPLDFLVDSDGPSNNEVIYIGSYVLPGGARFINNQSIKRIYANDTGCTGGVAGLDRINWRIEDEMTNPIASGIVHDNNATVYEDNYVIVSGDLDMTAGKMIIEISLKQECVHFIYHQAIDNLENKESGRKQLVYVDLTPPIINKTVGEPNYEIIPNKEYCITPDTIITFDAEDAGCMAGVGLEYIFYRIWNITYGWTSWYVANGETMITITEENTHYLEIKAVDYLGNQIIDNETFHVDSTPPLIQNVSITPDTLFVNQQVHISSVINDEYSGIQQVTINISGPLGFTPINTSMILNNGKYTYTFTPNTPGLYHYFIWTTDHLNNSGTSSTIPFTVYQQPHANFTYSPILPDVTELVVFNDNSYDADGYITTREWSFGDGNTSTEQNPSHAYDTSGRYQVTLTVTDNDGISDTHTKLIPVGLNLTYLHSLSSGWNFISIPFNESVDNTDFLLNYKGYYYGLDDGIINSFMYGWNRAGQYYNFANTFNPGFGYWVFSYEDCELWIEEFAPNTDDYITSLESGWNVIGLPFDQSVNKEDVIVRYDDSDHTWSQAVSDAIVVNFVYGWDRAGQFYNFADMFNPGYSYWVYASQSCVLKRSV